MKEFSDKELIVRKIVSSFIEKIFRYLGYDFYHDDFKAVLYGEKQYNTKYLEKMKRYYDAYLYLLSNSKNPLTHSLLNTFHFILKEKEMDNTLVNNILKHYYYLPSDDEIKKAIIFHLLVKEELSSYDELDRLIIPLMILNYILVKSGVPTIRLVYTALAKYHENLNDKEELISYLYETIINFNFISKKFMMNLKPISLKKVVKTFVLDEKLLKEKYKIKNLMIYGSFAKNNERIDSDIDLLVNINKDLLFEEREQIIKEIKEYYTKKFKRFVDVHEISEYLKDQFIHETKIKKIVF